MMDTDTKNKLFETVREALATNSYAEVLRAIADCHDGRLDGYIVTNENLHLFRIYRNSVSPNPARMIKDADG